MRITLFLLITFCGCASTTRIPTPGVGAPEDSGSFVVPRLVADVAVRDSQIFRPRGAGISYRYGSGEVERDVYVYPKESWPDPASQARTFVDALAIERRRGRFDSYEVLTNVPFNLQVDNKVFAAQEVTFRIVRKGEPRNSYFAVVSLPDRYFKLRVTRRPAADDGRHREFVRLWVEAYVRSAGG